MIEKGHNGNLKRLPQVNSDLKVCRRFPRRLSSLLSFSVAMGLFCFGSQRLVFGQVTILHNFADGTVRPDAANPIGGLIQSPDGTFFGVASGHSGSYGIDRTGDVYQFSASGNVKVVQEMLGHSRVSMTLEVYSHVLPGMQEDAAVKMSKLFE